MLAAGLAPVVIAGALALLATAVSSSREHAWLTPSPTERPRLSERTSRIPALARAERPQLVGRGGPIRFQPHACLAFPATGRWNGATIFLDPGHGGVDSGALGVIRGRIVTEKQVTLALGMRALELLRGAGYRVVISRSSDTTVASFRAADFQGGVLSPDAAQREIEARNLCADAAHADVLVGLHMNGFADPSASGAETVYCPSRPFAARNRLLADLIQRAVVAGIRRSGVTSLDRGVLPDREAGGAALTPQTANYHHLIQLGPADPPWLPYPSLMPGVVMEPAFVSNPGEASLLLSTRGQEVVARALLDALDSYFGRSGLA